MSAIGGIKSLAGKPWTMPVVGRIAAGVIARNADVGVTWVHSYVSEDKRKTYCVYDGPSPEAVRRAADANGLPVDRVTLVSVLDPYFYR